MLVEFTKGKATLPVWVNKEEVIDWYGDFAICRIEGDRATDINRRLGEGKIKLKHGTITQHERSIIVFSVQASRR